MLTQSAALIREMGAEEAPLLGGYRIKILDGNALGAREHRLEVTRGSTAAPLPGQSLSMFVSLL